MNETMMQQDVITLSFENDQPDIVNLPGGNSEIIVDVGKVRYTHPGQNYWQGEITAVLGIDRSLTGKYNDENNTDYRPLPETACALENQSATIFNGSGQSTLVRLVVKAGDPQIEKNVIYVVPVSIQSVHATPHIETGTDKTVFLLLRFQDVAALTPQYIPDDQVVLESDGSPDWVKHLIMVEMRIRTATGEGTLDAAVKALDHYRDMGVNGIWITPVYDPGARGNGYSNLGPHTIDPKITGTSDYEQGWAKMTAFIDEAHQRNIRIFLDVITWGAVSGSGLIGDHPQWFSGSAWDGDAFNWSHPEFTEWFIRQLVTIGLNTRCDGFRFDCEPEFAGYGVVGQIRDRLLAQGRKAVMMSEAANERRGVYLLEQRAIEDWLTYYRTQGIPPYTFIDKYNIVDFIKSGQIGGKGMYRFYVNNVTCHDNIDPVIWGNRLAIGYQMIFAPYIPLWYIGEEWNNPHRGLDPDPVLYYNRIDWTALEKAENRAFFEDVKFMIFIRRQYPEIFAYFPEHQRDVHICKVEVSGGGLQAYARYAGNKAILIIPGNSNRSEVTVSIPYSETGLASCSRVCITDLKTGRTLAEGAASDLENIKITPPQKDMSLLMVEGR